MASQTKNISITKTTQSKIDTVDFNNLPFGSIYSDHVMICDFENGVWSEPRIEPYGPITLDPAAKIFHYGHLFLKGWQPTVMTKTKFGCLDQQTIMLGLTNLLVV